MTESEMADAKRAILGDYEAAQWAIMRCGAFVVQSSSNYMGMYFLNKGDHGENYLAYRRPPEKEEDIR